MAKEELLFSDYVAIILRRKWFVLTVIILTTIGTYWWASQEQVIYKSKTLIKILRQVTFAEIFDSVLASSGDPLQNYTHEITSSIVASNAAAALSYPTPPTLANIMALRHAVKVSILKYTDILEITTTGASGLESKRRGEAIVTAFITLHDKMMRQNALDVYNSIKESRDIMIKNLKQRESDLLRNIGFRIVGGTDADELLPLRRRLITLQSKLHEMRASGNYTEEYPEIVDLKSKVSHLETDIAKKLELEFEKRSQLSEYERDKIVLTEIAAFFSRKIEEAKIAASKKNEIITLVEPTPEGTPVGTGKKRKTVAGGLLGLMLGIVLAFAIDHLDTSIRTLREVEEEFKLPVLAVIPHFSLHDPTILVGQKRWLSYIKAALPLVSLRVLGQAFRSIVPTRDRSKSASDPRPPELIVPFVPRSPVTEAYRSLRTNIEFALNGKSNALLITSAGPGEGKTTTFVNLAIVFGQSGKKVLLVGANMRRPQIYRIFGLSREKGLSDILLGDIPWSEAVKDYRDIALGGDNANLATASGMDNLFFITCGGRTLHPAEWLSQPIFVELLKEWKAAYDFVLVDAPPLLPVTDSVVAASVIKHTIIVYQIGVTARESVRRAITSLQNTGTNIEGIVINDLYASWTDHADFFQYRAYYGKKE